MPRFRATLELNGKTATGLRVPDEVVAALGGGGRPAVRVTLNGHTYRSSVAARGGRYLLGVSAEQRAAAGVAAGDEVEVELELDTAPREAEVPADLAAALAADAEAAARFAALTATQRGYWSGWVEGAKRAETRAARVERALGLLREGRRQP